MAGTAVANSQLVSLVLQRLTGIGTHSRRDHGVRAAVTGRAVKIAMTCRVTVQVGPGINSGNAGMAGDALRFVEPGRPAVSYRTAYLIQVTMTRSTFARRISVLNTALTFRDDSRVTIEAVGLGVNRSVETVYRFREGFYACLACRI
jgi:hypothetical protein